MRCIAPLFAMIVWCPVAVAGPIADRFPSGVLGFSWGASLDSIVGVFPDGEHVYATTPGERAYRVQDDQDFMGVTRSRQTLRYGFDQNDELVVVAFSFPYERKEQVTAALIFAFGQPSNIRERGRQQSLVWGEDRGVSLVWKSSIEPEHGIAWLCVFGPNYPKDDAKTAREPQR